MCLMLLVSFPCPLPVFPPPDVALVGVVVLLDLVLVVLRLSVEQVCRRRRPRTDPL